VTFRSFYVHLYEAWAEFLLHDQVIQTGCVDLDPCDVDESGRTVSDGRMNECAQRRVFLTSLDILQAHARPLFGRCSLEDDHSFGYSVPPHVGSQSDRRPRQRLNGENPTVRQRASEENGEETDVCANVDRVSPGF